MNYVNWELIEIVTKIEKKNNGVYILFAISFFTWVLDVLYACFKVTKKCFVVFAKNIEIKIDNCSDDSFSYFADKTSFFYACFTLKKSKMWGVVMKWEVKSFCADWNLINSYRADFFLLYARMGDRTIF